MGSVTPGAYAAEWFAGRGTPMTADRERLDSLIEQLVNLEVASTGIKRDFLDAYGQIVANVASAYGSVARAEAEQGIAAATAMEARSSGIGRLLGEMYDQIAENYAYALTDRQKGDLVTSAQLMGNGLIPNTSQDRARLSQRFADYAQGGVLNQMIDPTNYDQTAQLLAGVIAADFGGAQYVNRGIGDQIAQLEGNTNRQVGVAMRGTMLYGDHIGRALGAWENFLRTPEGGGHEIPEGAFTNSDVVVGVTNHLLGNTTRRFRTEGHAAYEEYQANMQEARAIVDDGLRRIDSMEISSTNPSIQAAIGFLQEAGNIATSPDTYMAQITQVEDPAGITLARDMINSEIETITQFKDPVLQGVGELASLRPFQDIMAAAGFQTNSAGIEQAGHHYALNQDQLSVALQVWAEETQNGTIETTHDGLRTAMRNANLPVTGFERFMGRSFAPRAGGIRSERLRDQLEREGLPPEEVDARVLEDTDVAMGVGPDPGVQAAARGSLASAEDLANLMSGAGANVDQIRAALATASITEDERNRLVEAVRLRTTRPSPREDEPGTEVADIFAPPTTPTGEVEPTLGEVELERGGGREGLAAEMEEYLTELSSGTASLPSAPQGGWGTAGRRVEEHAASGVQRRLEEALADPKAKPPDETPGEFFRRKKKEALSGVTLAPSTDVVPQ